MPPIEWPTMHTINSREAWHHGDGLNAAAPAEAPFEAASRRIEARGVGSFVRADEQAAKPLSGKTI